MLISPITRTTFVSSLLYTAELFGNDYHPPRKVYQDPVFFKASSRKLRNRLSQEIESSQQLAGPFLRLAFHDATTYENSGDQITGGLNGSIRFEIESRSENRGLSKPYNILYRIWEEEQGGEDDSHLSLADTIALAGAVAVETAGGPAIPIRLGRADATVPDPEFLRVPQQAQTRRSRVEKTLPTAGLDSDGLRLYFGRLGLSEPEWVALCGSHGLGRHVTMFDMPRSCVKNLTRTCLEEAPVLMPFVARSVDRFDNTYFQILLRWNDRTLERGEGSFIGTDVAMVVDPGLRPYVVRYANDQYEYFRVFRRSYQKLVGLTATSRGLY